MRKIKVNSNIIFLFRIILGFVFIYASIYKIAEPSDFAASINNYKIFPVFTVNILAILLPWLELITGIFMIFGIFVKASSYIITFFMAAFTVLVFITILRGIDISCGCYTSDINSAPVGWSKFAENSILFLMSLLVYYSNDIYLSAEKYFKTNKIT